MEQCGIGMGEGFLIFLFWKRTGGSQLNLGSGEVAVGETVRIWPRQQGWMGVGASRGGAPDDASTLCLQRGGARALLSIPSFQLTPQHTGWKSQQVALEIWSGFLIYKRENRDPGRRCDLSGAAPRLEPWCPAPSPGSPLLPFIGVCVSAHEGICLLPPTPILSAVTFPALFLCFASPIVSLWSSPGPGLFNLD